MTLSDEFEKTLTIKLGSIRRLINKARVITGGNEFYSSQRFLTEKVHNGGQICEWQVQNLPSVLIMPEKIGQALLQNMDIDLVKSHYQYPKEEFKRVRNGEIALGMTKEWSPMAIMIRKDKVEEALDLMKRGQNEMGGLLERVQRFMGDNNLTPQDFGNILDGIDANPEEIGRLLERAESKDDFRM